jgi:hypothetical protein
MAILAIPRELADQLIAALVALEYGETMPILEPKSGRRRRMAFTLAEFEATALVLAGWRYGEGSTKRQAMQLVADAYGVSFDTLRQWEKKHASADLITRAALASALVKGADRAAAIKRSKANFERDKARYRDSELSRAGWERWRLRQAAEDADEWAKIELKSMAAEYKASKSKAKNRAR